jgi:hypothetical protein
MMSCFFKPMQSVARCRFSIEMQLYMLVHRIPRSGLLIIHNPTIQHIYNSKSKNNNYSQRKWETHVETVTENSKCSSGSKLHTCAPWSPIQISQLSPHLLNFLCHGNHTLLHCFLLFHQLKIHLLL